MSMPQSSEPFRVVVGVDFDETSEIAFAHGVRAIRGEGGGELHLVHVLWELDAARGERLATDSDRIEDAYLRLRGWTLMRADELSGARGSERIHFHVRLGKPAVQLHQV